MHRLFAGLELPPPLRDVLLGTMGGVAGARWQTDAQLHLTLRFIGDVDRHRAQDIAAALGQVRAPPFTLALGAPGVFETRGVIDTLWVGVTPHAAVKALAQRIDQALVRVGIAPEARAFLPHITLARLGRGAGPVDAALAQVLPALSFDVDGFALFESTLGAGGSVYDIVERYRF
jgi:2'-5' RNA ligase